MRACDGLRLQPLERRRQRQRQRQRRASAGGARDRRATAAHVRSTPADEVMPPTGNHPVRAARNTSASDPISGGTDRPMTESTRTIDAADAARPAAGIDAERNADQRGEQQRDRREHGGVERALADQRADRAASRAASGRSRIGRRRPATTGTATASGRSRPSSARSRARAAGVEVERLLGR